MAPTSSSREACAAASEGSAARTLAAPLPAEGLYVHFPFCVSICPYCDFVVVAGSAARGPRNRIEALLGAIHIELRLRSELSDHVPLRSVYIGGGTPSLLTVAQLGDLLEDIAGRIGIAADAEITIEANPGADEIGDLAGFRAAGVSRLSIGAQSMQAAELRRLGRRHVPADVVAAVRAGRLARFDAIGLDLLTDVPGQTLESWGRTLRAVLGLEPDHLSVYSLSLDDPDAEGLTAPDGDHLPLSRGARAWRERAAPEQSQDRAARMELLTDELAATAGLHRYEIANLARPGQESRHNLLYWRRRPYLALGPGAHASDGARRRSWNAARLDGYIESLQAARLPPGGLDEVDEATALAEAAILGLRLREGIDPELTAQPAFAPGLDWGRQHQLVEDVDGRARLTRQGRLLANEVFSRLLPEAGPRSATSTGGS